MSVPSSQARGGQRFKRCSTRHRGITFRVLSDGTRAYFVTWKGTYLKAAGEKEALALQGDLRARTASGQRVVVASKTTFAEIAEEWFASRTRVGAWTRRGYRDALDSVLLPGFGSWKIGAVSEDAIAKLVRDLERDGLHSRAVEASDSNGIKLLGDIRAAFAQFGDPTASVDLCAHLNTLDERPWGGWRDGAGLNPRTLASQLRRFDVRPKTVRLADGTTPKGYHLEWFDDAFARYIPALSATSATTAQPSRKQGVSIRHNDPLCGGSEEAANPHGYADVADVADRSPEEGVDWFPDDVSDVEHERGRGDRGRTSRQGEAQDRGAPQRHVQVGLSAMPRPRNLCRSCAADFTSTDLFDRHRVGVHGYLYAEGLTHDPPVEAGRRCLDAYEMVERGWQTDGDGRWFDPVKADMIRRHWREQEALSAVDRAA